MNFASAAQRQGRDSRRMGLLFGGSSALHCQHSVPRPGVAPSVAVTVLFLFSDPGVPGSDAGCQICAGAFGGKDHGVAQPSATRRSAAGCWFPATPTDCFRRRTSARNLANPTAKSTGAAIRPRRRGRTHRRCTARPRNIQKAMDEWFQRNVGGVGPKPTTSHICGCCRGWCSTRSLSLSLSLYLSLSLSPLSLSLNAPFLFD